MLATEPQQKRYFNNNSEQFLPPIIQYGFPYLLIDNLNIAFCATLKLYHPSLFFNQKNVAMPNKKMNSIKDKDKYEALRDKGMSKEKAARISNSPGASHRGGKASNLDDRSKDELYQEAKKIGIEGRSKMSKSELINAIRNH
jgi:hypothetical protein